MRGSGQPGWRMPVPYWLARAAVGLGFVTIFRRATKVPAILTPRRFEAMTPYAYLLSDPRSVEPDKTTLQALSRELQLKLFGASGGGEKVLGDDSSLVLMIPAAGSKIKDRASD